MRIAVFIICICLLLARGVNDGYIAICHDGVSHHLVQQPSKNQPITFVNNHQDYITTDVNGLNGFEELLINEEEDDEETDKALARKCKPLEAENLIHFYFIHTESRPVCCNATKPYYSLLSNKYISQRVLRI